MVIAKRIFLVLVLLSLLSILVIAEENETITENDCIYYFYGDECEDCTLLEPYLSNLEEKYPNLQLEQFEVYHSLKNYRQLQSYLKAYGVGGTQLIPIAFISGSYFVGKDSITNFLEERIKDNQGSECPSLEDKAVGIIGKGEFHNVLATLTVSVISKEAFDNIFRPGIIVLALILLALISLAKSRKDMVRKSLIYIVGVYFAYFLFGIGLGGMFYNSSLYSFFYKFVGVLGILFGLAGIKVFIGTWELVVKMVPEDLKKYLRIIYGFSVSAAGVFLLSFVISLFTFASVSDKFLSLRDLFAGGFMKGAVLPLILYYNLILVLALGVLLLIFNFIISRFEKKAAKKVSDKKIEIWKNHYTKLLNLSLRVIVLILGIVLLVV